VVILGDLLDAVYLAANEIASAEVCPDELIVKTVDGRTIHTPLAWFEFLVKASEVQRQNFRVTGWSILWEDLDEGISMEPILLGRPDWKHPNSEAVESANTASV
jgi:hypothetical protein